MQTVADEEYVTFKFKYTSVVDFQVGDNLTVYGSKYILRKLPTPIVKNGSNNYEYTLKFQSPRAICNEVNFTLFDDTDTPAIYDFPVTLSPKKYAELIVNNMNRIRTNENWVVGQCIDATPKEGTFSNASCLTAMVDIATLFETESWVSIADNGDYEVNIGKRVYVSEEELILEQGKNKGLTKITRNESTTTTKVTRLVALGGETNIRGTYRNGSPRLMLPDSPYIDSENIDLDNIIEKVVTWDDIYPSLEHATEDFSITTAYTAGAQVLYNNISWDCVTDCVGIEPTNGTYWKVSEGTVSSVVSQFRFIDSNLSFNPLDSEYIMADETVPKVHFITGNLAGYEFPIANFNTITKQITIEQIQDATDSYLPTSTFGFEAGDQYVLVDLYMPESYELKAELRLLAKAKEYLGKYDMDQVSYTCPIDTIWATNNEIELHIGEMVKIRSTEGTEISDEDLSTYRIISLKRYLTQKYKYEITVSDLPYVVSRLTSIENNITNNNNYLRSNNLKSVMAKTRTFRGAQEALRMAFDPSGSYFTDKIKPLIVETSAVLAGTNEQQYTLTGASMSAKTTDVNYIGWTAGTLTDSVQEDAPRTWSFPAGEFIATDGDDASYRCYIKCPKESTGVVGEIVFTPIEYTTAGEDLYYYFLLGSFGKVINNMRQFSTSNGFTFVNGGSIVTNSIQNTQGTMKLDLLNELIDFHTADNTKYIKMDIPNGYIRTKGMTVVSQSGATSPLPVDRGEWMVGVFYYVGDTVTNGGSTWKCLISNSNITSFPGESIYWTYVSKKGDDGEDGISIIWKGESTTAPSNPILNWVYRNTTDGITYIYDGSAWGVMNKDGDGVNVQYSQDGTNWHEIYASGDVYLRQYVLGVWSSAIPFVGKDGKGISSFANTYQVGTSGTTAPTGTWTTEIPATSPTNKYLWNKEVTNYTNGDSSTTTHVISIYGDSGNGVTGVVESYGVSSDADTLPNVWVSDINLVTITSTNKYLWIKEVVSYSASADVVTTRISAVYGDKGEDGKDGTHTENRYAVNGSLTVAPIIDNTQTNPTGWYLVQPETTTLQYAWYTQGVKTSDGVLVGTWSEPRRLTGANGSDGGVGPAPTNAGNWSATESYSGSSILVEAVFYEANSTSYITRSDAGVIPIGTLPTDTNYWNPLEHTYRSIATGLLLADYANIANFIFKDSKLISQQGTVDGMVSTDYSNPSFIPNLVLDGANGYIQLPPSWSSTQTGKLNNEGISLVYSGDNSQSISWYSGLGSYAGQITTGSDGHLKLDSNFGIDIVSNAASNTPINIGTEGLGGEITIGNSLRDIVLGSQKIKGVARAVRLLNTSALAANTSYWEKIDTSMLVITSIGSGSSIYKITHFTTTENGEELTVINTTTSNLRLITQSGNSSSNIRMKENKTVFDVFQYSQVTLKYYGGYWYCPMDAGQ